MLAYGRPTGYHPAEKHKERQARLQPVMPCYNKGKGPAEPLATAHFLAFRLPLVFFDGDAAAGPGSSAARFAACLDNVCPRPESV
jgi:hypothetical protein